MEPYVSLIPMWLHLPIGIMSTIYVVLACVKVWNLMDDPRVKSITLSAGFYAMMFIFLTYWSWIIFG